MMSQMRNLTSRNVSRQYFKNLQQRKLMSREVIFQNSKHVQHRPDTSAEKTLRRPNGVADFSKNVVLRLDAKDVMTVIRIIIIQRSARDDGITGTSISKPQKIILSLTSLRRSVMQRT